MNTTIPITRNLCALALHELIYTEDGRNSRIIYDLSIIDECSPALHIFNTISLLAIVMYILAKSTRMKKPKRDQASECNEEVDTQFSHIISLLQEPERTIAAHKPVLVDIATQTKNTQTISLQTDPLPAHPETQSCSLVHLSDYSCQPRPRANTDEIIVEHLVDEYQTTSCAIEEEIKNELTTSDITRSNGQPCTNMNSRGTRYSYEENNLVHKIKELIGNSERGCDLNSAHCIPDSNAEILKESTESRECGLNNGLAIFDGLRPICGCLDNEGGLFINGGQSLTSTVQHIKDLFNARTTEHNIDQLQQCTNPPKFREMENSSISMYGGVHDTPLVSSFVQECKNIHENNEECSETVKNSTPENINREVVGNIKSTSESNPYLEERNEKTIEDSKATAKRSETIEDSKATTKLSETIEDSKAIEDLSLRVAINEENPVERCNSPDSINLDDWSFREQLPKSAVEEPNRETRFVYDIHNKSIRESRTPFDPSLVLSEYFDSSFEI